MNSSSKKASGFGHCLVFDDPQTEIFHHRLPLILIGSAGSGKTSLVLEKFKTLEGDLLYVTLSPYLVHNARRLYGLHQDIPDTQTVDFLSFEELLGTIHIPEGQEMTSRIFVTWFARQAKPSFIKESQKLYEEFRGVITGSTLSSYLSAEDYLNLGIRQALYAPEERQAVYRLFQGYLNFLKTHSYFDSSILAYDYRSQVQARYDYVVIDEVQDLTNSQLSFILKTLKHPDRFLLCGDANQIVYPNFFSWSKLKSQFYQREDVQTGEITKILTRNYRNTPQVTALANRTLKIKNARFGSVDKESHFLMESRSSRTGEACFLPFSEKILKDFNRKTRLSTHYAVLVLTEDQKEKAQQYFDTPLLFSIQEAKGLEYENVILFDFMSGHPSYGIMAQGLTPRIFDKDFTYGRSKDKSDKSLEIYKFYINALYVGITRAMGSVYFIESNSHHPLLKLLDIHVFSENVPLQASSSSLEEWQKESSRLAQQGKLEQSRAIEERILKQRDPPWKPLDCEQLDVLKQKIFKDKTGTKQEKLFLLEYALLYGDRRILLRLNQEGVHAAQNLPKARLFMEEKYVSPYKYKNATRVHSEIADYGLEHRNLLSLTPLMTAAYAGNIALIKELLDLGASQENRDLQGRTPFQIALFKGQQDAKTKDSPLTTLYDLLKPDSLSLNIGGKLIKIDVSRSEYLLFTLILLFQDDWILENQLFKLHTGFTAQQLSDVLSGYEEEFCPAYRKQRHYVSSVLSRNEVNSSYSANRALFRRAEWGYYQINPHIHIKTQQGWQPITEICCFKSEFLPDHFLFSPLMSSEELSHLCMIRERWRTLFKK